MVVVDTSALEGLAEASRGILATLTSYPAELTQVQALSQSFNPFDPVFHSTRPVYDMEDYMKKISKNSPPCSPHGRTPLTAASSTKPTPTATSPA